MATALELLGQLQPTQPKKSALDLLNALPDQRQQKYIPAPEIPIDVPQGEPVPGFVTNLAKDVSNIGVNYLQGVGQAYNERVRASQRATEAAGDMLTGKISVADYGAAREQDDAATRQFVKDTVGTPAMIGALVGVPGAGVVAAPVIARDMYEAAKERYVKDGSFGAVKQVAGDVTGLGPLSEETPKLLTPEYWQQAYEQPLSTVGGTAMTLVPTALMVKGAYKGVKQAVETRAKSALELLDEIQPVKATEGLDALDQYNSPTRGFRPATPDELTAWRSEKQAAGQAAKAEALQQGRESALDILQRIGQKKWDETTRQYGDLIPPEAPNPARSTQVTKTAQQLLDELPVQKPSIGPVDLNSQLAEAITKKDYSSAANLAEQIGSPSFAEAYRKLARKENAARETLIELPPVVQERVNTFIDDALSQAGSKKHLPLFEVTAPEVSRIQELTGIDTTGFRHVINNYDLRHAIKQHGDAAREAKRGQLPVTEKDLKQLPQILKNYDEILLGSQNEQYPSIRYVKRENDHITVAEVIMPTEKTLMVKTIWKKPTAQIVPDKSSPPYTSTSAVIAIPPERSAKTSSKSNFSIPENTEVINGKEFMANSGMTVPTSSPTPQAATGMNVPDTISRKQIVDKINNLFTVVRQGRLGRAGVLGWFDRNTEVIRTKDYADFRAIMHEVGHYLDKGLGLRAARTFDNELIGAVHRRFGNAYNHLNAEQLRGEGIAEFIHDYTTNPARAKAEFPNYYAAFEWRVGQEPQVRDRLKIATDMLHTWYNQASQERVKGSISFGDSRNIVERVTDAAKHPEETAKAIVEKGKALGEASYDRLFDQLAPLDRMMKEIEKMTGQEVPLAKDVFKQASLTRGWAGKAQTLIEHGLPDRQIPAFKDIVKKVEKDQNGFSAYVVALRELDTYAMEARGEGKFQHAVSNVDAMRTVAEGRLKPEFVEAQQALVKYQNHLLDLLVDAGIKDRTSVELMKAKWPNYAPFFREFNDAAIDKFFTSRGGFANVSDPVKKFKGSTKDIINPLESIIKNTYHFTNLAERNKVGRLFVDLAQQPGLGKLIEKVTGTANSHDSTFSVWNNGKKEVYATTPEMYRAITLLDREPAQGIMKILSTPASWLRAGAVLSPEFIARNPVRDAWTAFIYSKYGFIPGIDTVRGLMHFIKKDDLYWEYMNSGAAHAAMVSLDRDYLAQNIRSLMSQTPAQRALSAVNPKTYVDILRAFSEATEMSTRLAEYENARRGYSGVLNRLFSDQRTPRSAPEAALGARDIALDFSRSGVWGKEVNKYVAFWNATVQGADKMVREFRENPVRTSSKVFMSVTLPSIALYYLNRDDPRYQELPQWQKDLFWIIPTKETLVKIPKPFEVGILFGTSVERMLQYVDKTDPKAFKDFGKTTLEATLPGWLPTAMLPIIEWTTNYSFFMDRDLVPQSQSKLPAKLQYGPNTSAIGKGVGQMLDVSPTKVDNTIRGYTGGLGGLAMTASDVVTGAFDNRPTMRVSEYPGIRAFTATPYKSSQSVQDFYDRFQQVEEMVNEYKQTGAKPQGLDGKEYERLKQVNSLMTKIHQREKEIMSSNMSSEEKRNRLDQLKIHAVNYARIGLGKGKIAQ